MALILCHECARQVSTEALACPQCGAPPKRQVASSAPTPSVLTRIPTGATTPVASALSELARRELLNHTKISAEQIIVWFFFFLTLGMAASSRVVTRPEEHEPFALLAVICLLPGILVFRKWCKRRTLFAIIKQDEGAPKTVSVYFRAIWSVALRSCCLMIVICWIICLAFTPPKQIEDFVAFAVIIYVIQAFFVLDVPFWTIRKARKLIAKATPATPATPAPSVNPKFPKAVEAVQGLGVQVEGGIHEDIGKIVVSESENPQEGKSIPLGNPTRPNNSTSPATPPTREQWIRQVREAEIAVAAMEKEGRPFAVLWQANLDQMRANPPKEFSPSRGRDILARIINKVYPQILDNVIMRDWQAGRPPRLPPPPAPLKDIIEERLRGLGVIR